MEYSNRKRRTMPTALRMMTVAVSFFSLLLHDFFLTYHTIRMKSTILKCTVRAIAKYRGENMTCHDVLRVSVSLRVERMDTRLRAKQCSAASNGPRPVQVISSRRERSMVNLD